MNIGRKFEAFLRYERSFKSWIPLLFLAIILFDNIRPVFLLILAMHLYGFDISSGKIKLLLLLPFRRWELAVFSLFTGILLVVTAVSIGDSSNESILLLPAIGKAVAQFSVYWSLSILSAHFLNNNTLLPVIFFLLDFLSGLLPHSIRIVWQSLSPLYQHAQLTTWFLSFAITTLSVTFIMITRRERWA
ncbi:hypothetical protein KAH37_08310 [bacterium]|nr:hypothetical protein [bacterium]